MIAPGFKAPRFLDTPQWLCGCARVRVCLFVCYTTEQENSRFTSVFLVKLEWVYMTLATCSNTDWT